MGLGVWGLGFGVWGMGPNPQSPIPNPHYFLFIFFNFIYYLIEINGVKK
jgi:hypothetical protein